MQIGGYEILRELGRGAMGVVYLARDLQLGRLVAIKTIQFPQGYPDPATAELKQRFIREARAAANLNHPNIITIHLIGDHAGQPYIVMEYVEGQPMEAAFNPGSPWSAAQLLDGLRQVAAALDHAHAHGIVHRDVKPANILMSKSGVCKVADFGIVKILDEQVHTHTTGIVGTPTYIAPEQVRGEPVTARSDQYALAVTVYRLLAGRLPFNANNVAALYFQIVQLRPDDVSKFNPAVNPRVDAVLQRALDKDPAKRFGSCTEMMNTLRAALSAAPEAPPPRPEPESKPEPKPKPSPVPDPKATLIAFLALLAVVATGATWWVFRPQPQPQNQQSAVSYDAPPPVIKEPERESKPDRTEPVKESRQTQEETKDPVKETVVSPEHVKSQEQEPPPARVEPGATAHNSRDGLAYRWIVPGTYMMGCFGRICSSDEFRHKVTISKGFWLSQTEVTAGAYRRFVQATHGNMPETAVGREDWNADKMPISNVSHVDAASYCAWIGGRLPTEAEWEYAARAGTTGDSYGPLRRIAWIYGDDLIVYARSHDGTYPPVGTREPNRFGLYDMIGSVSEWVSDLYREDYYRYSPEVDPQGPERGSSYVHRGGSILSIESGVKVSARGRGTDSRYTSPEIGFRCVGGMPPP